MSTNEIWGFNNMYAAIYPADMKHRVDDKSTFVDDVANTAS